MISDKNGGIKGVVEMGNLRKNERKERIAAKGERKKTIEGKSTVSDPDPGILLNLDPDPDQDF